MTRTWTAQEVSSLPVVVDVVTAGSVLGLGRSASHEQARAGTFPVPVLRLGQRYRVVTQDLLQLLGLSSSGNRSTRAGSSPHVIPAR